MQVSPIFLPVKLALVSWTLFLSKLNFLNSKFYILEDCSAKTDHMEASFKKTASKSKRASLSEKLKLAAASEKPPQGPDEAWRHCLAQTTQGFNR